ncbi:MAG: hypothetical protein ACFE75_01160 [Candidatus Hodarchaeota archaeon]
MNKLNKFFDNLFKFLPGYIFGMLTFSIGLLGELTALLLSPEYIMWKYSISWLTLYPAGIYLRLGLIISNIMAIPFYIYLGKALRDENTNEIIRKIAIGSGIFSSVSAVGTGAVTGIDPLISRLHGLFALFSWIGGAITCLFFGVLMLKNSRFSKIITYINFIVAGIFLSFLIPFFITNFCSFFQDICYYFGQAIYVIMPVYEWTLIFSILLWYLSNSYYLVYKKI